MMNRRNYAHKSGVIIDVCREHGVWFDPDELQRILAWIRAGGRARAEKELAAEEVRREGLKRLSRPTTGTTRGVPSLHAFDAAPGDEVDLGRVFADVFSWLCGR